MTDTPDPRIERVRAMYTPRKHLLRIDREQERINGAMARAEWEARNPEPTGAEA